MQTLELKDVKRTLGRWRRSRNGVGRIPAEIWKMAAQVAVVRGVQDTALALRLDATRLSQWMPLPNPIIALPRPADVPAFLELPP